MIFLNHISLSSLFIPFSIALFSLSCPALSTCSSSLPCTPCAQRTPQNPNTPASPPAPLARRTLATTSIPILKYLLIANAELSEAKKS